MSRRIQDFFEHVTGIPGPGLVIDGAVELMTSPTGWRIGDTQVHFDNHLWTLPEELSWMRDRWLRNHPSEFSGSKLALRSFESTSLRHETISLGVERTEWREVRAFHEAFEATQVGPGWTLADLWKSGRSRIPNIAVVHSVLETADDMIIISQRGRTAHYHPQRWSVSFEEGCELDDLSSGNALFHETAARGAREELSISGDVHSYNFRLLSIVMEYPLFNLAIVAYGKIPLTSEQLAQARLETSPQVDTELQEVKFLPFNLTSAAYLALRDTPERSDPETVSKWHPTSRYRLVAAMRYRFGDQATFDALHEGRDA